MKETIKTLLDQLERSNASTRLVMAVGAGLLIAVTVFFSVRASNPSFQMLLPGLSETQMSDVTNAVATAGIRFQVHGNQAPYSVWVEDNKVYEARAAVATNSSLSTAPKGIASTTGTAKIFLSQGERKQGMRKAECEEVEKQLETYDFISSASVTASAPRGSVLGRNLAEQTVAAQLTLRGVSTLTREQSETVARNIIFAMGVPRENVCVSDHFGNKLYDGGSDGGFDSALAHQETYDKAQTRRIQAILDRSYGAGLVIASIHGEWTFDKSEKISKTIDGSKGTISEVTNDTETPISSPNGLGGGPTGAAANGAGGVTPAPASSTEPAVATTSNSTKTNLVGTSTELVTKNTPVLTHLSGHLTIDISLEEHEAKILASVKEMAGYQEERGDKFSSILFKLPDIERDENDLPIVAEADPAPESLSPMMGTLIERGIEIGAALIFLLVLFKTMKKGTAAANPVHIVGNEEEEVEIDVEILARARVEELLKTDPERVGALLSRWALTDPALARMEK